MTYKKYDVVTVPFPFTDSAMQKRRPALVLSDHATFNAKIGHSVMAMITSEKNAPWPLDVKIGDLKQAGLPAPSVVRTKLFTLDHRFVVAKIGVLSNADRLLVNDSLDILLATRK
ncbi:MAG TPA: type II toxin-antitoxin system PemK/MazF family toxin [Sulfuricella sp.]|nr:type II toxin-antitoxin system PemK/MazF family toxin [Sulfuricella sp.]